MIPGGVNELLLRSAAAGGATAGRSVRFNSGDSAYLSRTPASAGNRRTSTLSFWTKKVTIGGGDRFIFSTSGDDVIRFNSDNKLRFYLAGTGAADLESTQLFRDPSAWYHFVFAFDTTQGTASDRIKVYLNGVQITAWGTATYPSQNYDMSIGNSVAHYFGRDSANANHYNGYLALVHYVNGQALTPSSFGETSATTGQWIAKTYSGTYGTNGFFLDFADNSTAAALGYDAAGSNDWTVNNLSVTAGAGNDSLRDHPTSAGTSTGAGGEVSGNYCTWNPLAATTSNTYANGNLDATVAQLTSARGSFAVSTGKWYWEIIPTNAAGYAQIGICGASNVAGTPQGSADGWTYYQASGDKFNNNASASYGNTYAQNDVVGVAVDLDNGKIWWSKNGTWQASGNPATGANAAFSNVTGSIVPVVSTAAAGGSHTFTANFGQRAFAYTAPSGFSPLVDTLLPTPTIAKPNTVMDVKLWTGNGTTTGNTQTISGLGFSPDLVWIKERSSAGWHVLCDTVRGTNKTLYSNDTYQEESLSNVFNAFNSDGFQVAYNSSYTSVFTNRNSQTYAGWCWDAGSSNATNTSGTITSTVRANISAGFSIVTYQGNGNTTASFGHGLGVTPHMVIIKSRATPAASWIVWHRSASAANDHYLVLNTTAAVATNSVLFQNVSSSVVTIGSADNVNTTVSPGNVAYCWTPVAGYSAFGSYTGNGSSDGPFVYTGFRPRWVMVKRTDSATNANWTIVDTARDTYNVVISRLFANLSDAEITNDNPVDILSNGFKLRTTSGNINASGGTFIYACFAEAPLPYARAR